MNRFATRRGKQQMATALDDDFDDDDEWVEDDAEEEVLLNCPSCKREVHEDAQQCPYCGDWINPVDLSDRPRRLIWVVAVVLLILAMTGVFFLRF